MADAFGVAEVFEGYWNAVEGAARTAFGELTVRVFGLLEGDLGGGGEKGVEGVVKGVDPIDVGLSQLYGGELTVVDEPRGLVDGQVMQLCRWHG